jgi:hypothetical protein
MLTTTMKSVDEKIAASTHYLPSPHHPYGWFAFGPVDRCENCGAVVTHMMGPWHRINESYLVEKGLQRLELENQLYYSENTDSNDCCDACGA